MKSGESSVAGGAGLFHTTRWTLVMASAHDQSQAGREALAALCLLRLDPINDRPDRFMPILPAMLYDACRL